ncbi:hypothetical protein [Saccharopolyspora phatthalungensis]|uniref:Uncharacterized protein n=1 Tax=Saccharopolyspora phatthalungensis TaxID=664693 RepID=A0A840QDV0_9PSEU|nr:hypothetical protein [Saccharopolyspora phatthalungensis]MBB5156838.1 hypothetical protein [Saccharopolyspora phatthalungensis]
MQTNEVNISPDRRRNERLARLRSIVHREFAVVAHDLASSKAEAVADHDSQVLGHMSSRDTWETNDELLDWVGPIAAKAGFASLRHLGARCADRLDAACSARQRLRDLPAADDEPPTNFQRHTLKSHRGFLC